MYVKIKVSLAPNLVDDTRQITPNDNKWMVPGRNETEQHMSLRWDIPEELCSLEPETDLLRVAIHLFTLCDNLASCRTFLFMYLWGSMSRGTLKQVGKFRLLSYQKKDWRARPHKSFFLYDNDYKYVIYTLQRLYVIVGVVPKEGLAGSAHQSCFWYDNDKDL